MKPFPSLAAVARPPMRFSATGWMWICFFIFSVTKPVTGQDLNPVPDPALPQPIEAGHFDAILGNSPFLRTLSLSDTFALRGIAEIDGEKVATLYNRETKKSVLVSATKINPEQMQLVSVNGAKSLEGVSATIAVSGEEVELKFEPERVVPKPKGYKGGGSAGGGGSSGPDGKRKGPSKEDMERYQKLSESQKEKFREYIRGTMQKYPNMSREERGNLIRGALTRLSEGGAPSSDGNGGGDRR